nr:uncharacterized protein LOC123002800 [Drosophila takahashii]
MKRWAMSFTNNKIPDSPHYFIPHQCVLQPQSTSTKLRVVFVASSRTSTQVVLNDILMVGPTIQEELYSTLLRFRLHKFALAADVKKMYRQVMVDEADRNFQLIVWRRDPSESLKIFKLNTVTYGTSPVPYLSIRCLMRLGEIAQDSCPKAAKVIQNDFYVDDLLTGARSVEDLLSLRDEVSQVLQEANLNWQSGFLTAQSYAHLKASVMPLTADSDVTKALGVVWLPGNDYFQFRLDDSFLDLRATKRNILSVTARLFDPLGLLCPLVTRAKMLSQELWLRKLDWDESLPMQLQTSWEAFKGTLLQLPKIKVSRFVHTDAKVPAWDIHGFADASMRAYGACITVRTSTAEGLKVSLLTAKSKVAPLKTKTLPRLELCAAHLLADLYNRVRPLLNFPITKVFLWTDSEFTLHSIKTHPSSLSVLVPNRVAEIQEWSEKAIWRHVPTKVNPADIVSRGCDVEELTASIWFAGPSFLLDAEKDWPVNRHFEVPADVVSMELRKSALALVVIPEPNCVLQKIESFSSHIRLLRVFVWVYVGLFKDAKKCRSLLKKVLLQDN